MRNELARHLTDWKAWFALLSFFPLLIASTLTAMIGLGFGDTPDVAAYLTPVTFVAFAAAALLLLALAARRWPTTRDLALTPGITGRQWVVLAVTFVVTHVIFWLLGLGSGESSREQAERFFGEMRLDGPVLPAAAGLLAAVLLAPVCEEILYRGAIVRPLHDSFARRGRATVGAVIGILVAAIAFALPHLGGALSGRQAVAYLVTGVAFGVVYVVTGSMTATMVSHSLQSCFAMGQVLLLGSGEHTVSPALYILVLGCPLWTYLVARGLHRILPKGRM